MPGAGGGANDQALVQELHRQGLWIASASGKKAEVSLLDGELGRGKSAGGLTS